MKKLCKKVNNQKAIETRLSSVVVIEGKLILKHLLSLFRLLDYKADAVRIGIANALELTFSSITTIELQLVCMVFLIVNLFA